MNLPTVTRTIAQIKVHVDYDNDPDLSWLDQTDEQMGNGFENYASERKQTYANGDWRMVGIWVEVVDNDGNSIDRSVGLWGVESDSDRDYLKQVAQGEIQELADSLGVNLLPVPVRWVGEDVGIN